VNRQQIESEQGDYTHAASRVKDNREGAQGCGKAGVLFANVGS
jgi:hypothetical protein